MSNDYFVGLNYSLGNEDTRLEAAICKDIKAKNIWSIAGCGGRALPLINESTENLHVVDISPQQIYLTQLRHESILKLNYQDFLKFWAFPPYSPTENKKFRKEKFYSFVLRPETKKYFSIFFKKHNWESPLFHGNWEKTFIIFSKIIRKIMRKKDYEIFDFDSIEKQKDFYDNTFSKFRWNIILFILGNKSVFNKLLYKGNFIEKNVNSSHFEYYQRAFKHIFKKQLCRDNFFINLCFFGKLNSQHAKTVEAEEEVFTLLKKKLTESQVHFHACSFQSSLEKINSDSLDYISISDVPSYFSGDLENNFIQIFKPYLKKDGILCLRSYLRVPNANRAGFIDVAKNYQALIDKEQVQMYQIEVLKKV